MIRRPQKSKRTDTIVPTRRSSDLLTLDNRFVMAPMGRSSAQDGVLSPAYAPYYARRAAGGAALIIGEATAVDHPTAMHMHTSSTIHGRGAEAWAKVAEAVHAEIGRATCRERGCEYV